MTNKVLIAQNSLVQPYPMQSFNGSDSARIIQFNPQINAGFTGSVVIEGSFALTPGNNDFNEILTVTFTGHTDNLTVEVQSNAPTLRARIVTSTQGAIAVFADSMDRVIQGSQGANPYTAYIESPIRTAGSGNSFKINTIVVPQFTSDDVFYANDFSKTVTDMLDGTNGAPGKQDKIGNGLITADETDVNVLTGTYAYGLTNADLQKLADVNATATEINNLIGLTGPVQAQLNTISASVPAGLAGITVSAADINSFFNAPVSIAISNLNGLAGLTATAADLNALTGTAGDFTAADMTKLGDINATAVEINSLSGFTGSSLDLNKIAGLTATSADLDATAGYAGTGVTSTEIGFLNGLTQNVETALNAIPNLAGLTASVSDLNTLSGIFSGTGAYANPVTPTEVSHLNGVVSNIQTQLNNKRDIGVTIGIAEISGASITTTELNYLQGATSNIQAQIDGLSSGSLTSAGGSLTGPLYMSNGSALAPGLGFVAPNTTTGFFLFGVNGIGVSVSGAQFLAVDGTDFMVGPDTTAGEPRLKGVGFGPTDPSYHFRGDEDTGMTWRSDDAVSIVAGAEEMVVVDALNDRIEIGGDVVNNNAVEVSGVFAGEKVLGRATYSAGSVSGAIGNQNIYTVPVGRNAIVTKVYVRLTNVTNFVNGSLFRFNLGLTPTPDELIDNTNNPSIFNPGTYAFDTAGQVMPIGIGANTFPAISGSGGADYQVLTASNVVTGRVDALAGADDYDFEVIVMGHEFV